MIIVNICWFSKEVDGHVVQAMVVEMLKERQQFQTELRTSEAKNSEFRCQIETNQYMMNDQSEELMSDPTAVGRT